MSCFACPVFAVAYARSMDLLYGHGGTHGYKRTRFAHTGGGIPARPVGTVSARELAAQAALKRQARGGGGGAGGFSLGGGGTAPTAPGLTTRELMLRVCGPLCLFAWCRPFRLLLLRSRNVRAFLAYAQRWHACVRWTPLFSLLLRQ